MRLVDLALMSIRVACTCVHLCEPDSPINLHILVDYYLSLVILFLYILGLRRLSQSTVPDVKTKAVGALWQLEGEAQRADKVSSKDLKAGKY